MRCAGAAALALVLALTVAPAAGAHDETGDPGDVTHRDTPAELAGADIMRALQRGELTSRSSATLAEYQPTTWCGTPRTTDDTVDAAFPATAARIKVAYAYPNDLPDRSAAWSDALQADVSHIGQYLALQSGGRRALRFDMGTNCGPQYVDVQVVPLPKSRDDYLAFDHDADDHYNEFDAVSDDVNAALGGRQLGRNVFVLADGLSDDDVYGIGEIYPTHNEADPSNIHNAGKLTGMMFVEPSTSPDPVGWWQPTVMLHEMTHNLGGVQFAAPHSTSYAHCTDGEDVMCYKDGSPEGNAYNANVCPKASGAIPQTYDCGHNDYYNPDPAAGSYLATHWNVYNSVFMASCAQLGTACGGDIVPTPPVNQGAPTVIGPPRRGTILTATLGSWLNVPSNYAIQWQRGVNGTWGDIPGANAPAYFVGPADVGAALRVTVTAANEDGAAIAASAPTATVTDPAAAAVTHHARTVRIRLRNGARHLAGTLTAKVRNVAAGREVSTPATKVSLPAGTWRLKLCAGRAGARPRCTTSARVHSRKHRVRLPAAKVVVGTAGTLKVTAAALDAKRRVRARGQAASD
jgi:hypothetical protein